ADSRRPCTIQTRLVEKTLGRGANADKGQRIANFASGSGTGDLRAGEREMGESELPGGQRARARKSRPPGAMDRGISTRQASPGSSLVRHLSRSQLRASRRTHVGN